MAPLTVQASVLSHVRLVGAQSRNVRSAGPARAQRMAVRLASAAAGTEAAPEAIAPEAPVAPEAVAPEAVAEAPAAAAEAVEAPAPAPEQQQFRQRRTGGRRAGPGPARTFPVGDLEVGREYEGAIVSIRDFGAFVNIGANTDGLLHISQISTEFVRNVADVVEVGQDVTVRVINVDMDRGKFAVTMIPEGGYSQRGSRGARDDEWEGDAGGERPQLKQQARAAKQQKPRGGRAAPPVAAGDVITGKIAGTAAFGVFVEIAEGFTGLLHESEQRREEGAGPLSVGDEVTVVVVSVRGEKVALSQRSAEEIEQSFLQEKKMSSAGVAVVSDLPAGAGVLARQMALAGISPDQFQAAVGAA